MPNVIQPTVGRIVYFYPRGFAAPVEQPLPAIVTAVWSDRCINAAVFLPDGAPMPNPPQKIPLVQPGDVQSPTMNCPLCTWMPYQVEKAEQLDAKRVAGEKYRAAVEAEAEAERRQLVREQREAVYNGAGVAAAEAAAERMREVFEATAAEGRNIAVAALLGNIYTHAERAELEEREVKNRAERERAAAGLPEGWRRAAASADAHQRPSD